MLHFIGMRAESTWLSRAVASVDGGLLAVSPALDGRLNDGCVLYQCQQCACMLPVGRNGCSERLRELHLRYCRWRYCLDVVSVYKVTTYPTRLETRIAEFSVCASH